MRLVVTRSRCSTTNLCSPCTKFCRLVPCEMGLAILACAHFGSGLKAGMYTPNLGPSAAIQRRRRMSSASLPSGVARVDRASVGRSLLARASIARAPDRPRTTHTRRSCSKQMMYGGKAAASTCAACLGSRQGCLQYRWRHHRRWSTCSSTTSTGCTSQGRVLLCTSPHSE